MSGFSGAVKLADLNDYLGPSQSCVKPMMKAKDDEKAGPSPTRPNPNQGPTVRIEMEVDIRSPPRSSSSSSSSTLLPVVGRGGHFAQMKEDREKKTATVSLNDCLACSGCVTSAETVLIQQQSLDQLKQVLQLMRDTPPSPPSPPAPRMVVMSLSPQSRASLAHHYSLSPLDTARKLTTFLHSVGISDLFDASSTLDFSLLEAQREFVAHYHATRRTSSTTPLPSSSSSPLPLPLLTSECPGWVCYAEKTQGAYILPHMSTVKSPQQVMGTLLKHWWSSQHSLRPVDVYHVSVQPCFDKKLVRAAEHTHSQHCQSASSSLMLCCAVLYCVPWLGGQSRRALR